MGHILVKGRFIHAGGESTLPESLKWSFDPKKTCCFTGHRPDMLPGGGDPSQPEYIELKRRTALYIKLLLAKGFGTFITGMSRGFDLLAADILMNDPQIAGRAETIAAVPYVQQINEMKTDAERELYADVMRKCDAAVVFFSSYTPGCYKVRNLFMVNYSRAIIGYLKDKDMNRSGSAQTVKMARRAGHEEYLITGEL